MNKKFVFILTNDEYQILRKAGMGLGGLIFPYKFERNPDSGEVTVYTDKPTDMCERINTLFDFYPQPFEVK